MPKNDNITLTTEELQLLLEAMEDEEFIMSIPLLLNDPDEGDAAFPDIEGEEKTDAKKEAL